MKTFAGRFEGKTMLVTGGTSGIGKAVCLRAGAEGAYVIVAGRNAERGGAVVDEIVKGTRNEVKRLRYEKGTLEELSEK